MQIGFNIDSIKCELQHDTKKIARTLTEPQSVIRNNETIELNDFPDQEDEDFFIIDEHCPATEAFKLNQICSWRQSAATQRIETEPKYEQQNVVFEEYQLEKEKQYLNDQQLNTLQKGLTHSLLEQNQYQENKIVQFVQSTQINTLQDSETGKINRQLPQDLKNTPKQNQIKKGEWYQNRQRHQDAYHVEDEDLDEIQENDVNTVSSKMSSIHSFQNKHGNQTITVNKTHEGQQHLHQFQIIPQINIKDHHIESNVSSIASIPQTSGRLATNMQQLTKAVILPNFPFSKNQLSSHQQNHSGLKLPSQLEVGYAVNLSERSLEDLRSFADRLLDGPLQVLDLSSNLFSKFPMELCKISSLKRLKLDNNLLKELPLEIFSAFRLELFSVANNLLTDIPPEICEWRQCLQHLNFSKNHISVFHNYLCYLDNLITLDVSSNDFLDIPFQMIKLVRLEQFSIDWFKYCLPPKQSTASGLEQIKSIFILLCQHREEGGVSFLEFTTYFSDPILINISYQFRDQQAIEPPEVPVQKFTTLTITMNQAILFLTKMVEQSSNNEDERKRRKIYNNNQNYQENKYLFILNIDQGNFACTQLSNKYELLNSNKQTNSQEQSRNQNILSGRQRPTNVFFQNCSIPNLNSSSRQPLTTLREHPENDNESFPGLQNNLIQFSSESEIHNEEQEEIMLKSQQDSQEYQNIQGSLLSNQEQMNVIRSLDIEPPPNKLLSEKEKQCFHSPLFYNKQTSRNTEEGQEGSQEMKIFWQFNLINPKNGRNLLHLAVLEEDIAALRCLIELSPNLIDQPDFEGHTPLSLSIIEEKYCSSKILIFSKADTNAGSGAFGSPLILAVIKLQYYLVRDLIRFGADVNKADKEGNRPLHYIFFLFNKQPVESIKIITLLLENGANPNIENNNKWSPLHFAAHKGIFPIFEFVVQYNKECTSFNSNKRSMFILNKQGGLERSSTLHIASQANQPEIVSILLNNKADITIPRDDNKTALQVCQKHLLVKKMIIIRQMNMIRHQFQKASANNRRIGQSQTLENLTSSSDGLSLDFEEEVSPESQIITEHNQLTYLSNPKNSSIIPSITYQINPSTKYTQTTKSSTNNNQNQSQIDTFNDQQAIESNGSLLEVEDEDLKGDVPKWFYKDRCQITYSPNNLQMIQDLNEALSNIANSHNQKAESFLPDSMIHQQQKQKKNKEKGIHSSGVKTPELEMDNFVPKFDQRLGEQFSMLNPPSYQTNTLFSNVKSYQEVITSVDNLGEYQTKLQDEGLALCTRLQFLIKLNFISFKLTQMIQLIMNSQIYQEFCRTKIIEDLLQFGNDNLSILVNTDNEFNSSILSIYQNLSSKPSFDNNTIIFQLINCFGGSNDQLISFIKGQSQIAQQRGQNYQSQQYGSSQNVVLNFTERMKQNYFQNILKDFIEFQQCQLTSTRFFPSKMSHFW